MCYMCNVHKVWFQLFNLSFLHRIDGDKYLHGGMEMETACRETDGDGISVCPMQLRTPYDENATL